MSKLTRRSVLRGSVGLRCRRRLGAALHRQCCGHDREVWLAQGFVPRKRISRSSKMVADYEKASGNKIDYSIIPFAPLRQKAVSAITSGVVPDMIEVRRLRPVSPLNAWDDKLIDVSDIVETQKSQYHPDRAARLPTPTTTSQKSAAYYGVPMRIAAGAVSYLEVAGREGRLQDRRICRRPGMPFSISSCRCRTSCATQGCATSMRSVTS